MKRIFISIMITVATMFQATAKDISPFIKVGEVQGNMTEVYGKVINALVSNKFTYLGKYNPEGKSSLKVIVFTRNDIKNTVVKVKDRGALAVAMRIGLQKKGNNIIVSYANPEYIFRAYLGNSYAKYKSVFDKFQSDLKKAMSSIGNEFVGFGGKENADKLKKYHYKIMMPYFTDPIELKTYNSFEEGLKTITANLKNKKSGAFKVYKIVYPSKKVAVFGVALRGSEKGSEAKFLPTIGESQLAAMPYEIILQNNKASMLHGKYRLALYWPELSMGTFMKIVSTPGAIEDILQSITDK